jgi:MEMO1 family protein
VCYNVRMDVSVRPSQIAGLWYEGDPKVLARAVDAYMDEAPVPDLKGRVVGVVAPHAGHRYSGPVAGYAFAAVRGLKPDVVAVLSPFHNYHKAPLLTTTYDAYGTPLGAIPIDRPRLDELDDALKSQLPFGLTRIADDPEHSLEIELPFLQRALASEWKLVPVMVRVQEPDVCHALGRAVARILQGTNALLVASTDLSHYYDQQVAVALDRNMLQPLEAFEPEQAFDVERSGHGYACGLGALTAVMWAARELGADRVEVLRHATSGDVTGDYSAVVGYAAAAIVKNY